MGEIADYYVTLKPIRENGFVPVGMNNIAFVNDPAVEEVGIYLNKYDSRIVANDTAQTQILEYLNSCGIEKPDNWTEVTEEEYFEAKNLNLSNNPEDSESYNDFQKKGGGGQWLVRYKYTGPFDGKNRSFCSSILRGGRLYTEEEIKNGLSNSDFGNYSIFDYKGSYGCRHFWKRNIFFEDYEDEEVRRVGNVPQVAAKLDDREATTLNAFLSSNEKMQVIAPLLIPDKRIPRNDELGSYNMIFSASTINDIYELALSKDIFNKKDLYKDTHQGDVAPSYVVEAWITLSEKDKAYSQYNFDIKRMPVGTLFVHSQVTDRVFWDREIKANKKYAYSIEALMNLSIVELSKQDENFTKTNNIKMEKSQVILPDGDHLIEGKIYTVRGGEVVEVKEVTNEQVSVLEDVVKDAATEKMNEATTEEKTKEELEETPKVVEETKTDTSEIEKLKEVQDEIIENLSKLETEPETIEIEKLKEVQDEIIENLSKLEAEPKEIEKLKEVQDEIIENLSKLETATKPEEIEKLKLSQNEIIEDISNVDPKTETSEIEKLKLSQDEIIEEVAKLRSQIETSEEEIKVEMSDNRPLWRRISDTLNVNQKSK